MVTRELLKKEIDHVQDEYLIPLYKIIKTFEHHDELNKLELEDEEKTTGNEDWYRFLDKFAGCLSDTPIERGNQGNFEIRDDLT